jgi:iron complex transport system permease protein
LENKTHSNNHTIQQYHHYTKQKKKIMLLMIIATLVLSVYGIQAGSAELTFSEIVRALMGKGTIMTHAVVWQMRLPRILGALIAGAGLATAGCVMQSNLRNPMASPTTLGITNAAAFGANIAIILFGAGSTHSSSASAVAINNPYGVTVTALISALAAMLIILTLAGMRGFSPESIILSGVALGSLFTAGTMLIQYFADDIQVAAAVFWSFGDLGRVMWQEVAIMAVVVGLGIGYFYFRRWDYNALNIGEDSAKNLGVNVEKIRLEGMLVASLMTAVTVSFMGIIGFVGLIAPQIVKRMIDGDHRYLIPMSAIMGAFILLLSDTIARTLIAPVMMPVGAITSFLGAPLFLYLLIRRGSR